jgi:hypothetical protein
MPDVRHEVLVVLEPRAAEKALARLRSVSQVIQVLPPRLAFVLVDAKNMARLARIQGVLKAYDDVPAKFPSDLTASERLFVSAWKARRQPKTRPGEGLPWDAPGYIPPDHSPHRR